MLAAPYAFATTCVNVGVAKVPDSRLDALAAMASSAKVVPAATEFIDVGGLVEGASQGEGLGNRFLAKIREVDAVVYVLRAFTEADVPGPTDPLEHLRIVELELTLADLESVETHIKRRRKAAKADPGLAGEVEALDAALAALAEGTPLYRSSLSAVHKERLAPWFLLTNKPVLVVVNIGEDQQADTEAVMAPLRAELGDHAEALPICVQLEAEAAQLDDTERADMLDGLGLGAGALARFVRTAYHLLGLRTFFTTGEDETRAWTFRAGATAAECAGTIHTDFERGFIRAETIDYQQLLDIGSWTKARETGKLRLEGRDYAVADGDVMEIRFNV